MAQANSKSRKRPAGALAGAPSTRKPRGFGHERRPEILAAAKELFIAGGFDAFSTRKLARKVGLSQTGLYVYFKSREEILDALCQASYEATLREYARIDAEVVDDLDRLRAMVRSTIAMGLAAPEEYQIIYMTRRKLLHGPGELKKPVAERSRGARIYHWQVQLMRRLVRSGRLKISDAELAAQIVTVAAHGLVARRIAWPDFPWADRGRLVDGLIDGLIGGLVEPS
jgi:AcrR family transcriptional regulator